VRSSRFVQVQTRAGFTNLQAQSIAKAVSQLTTPRFPCSHPLVPYTPYAHGNPWLTRLGNNVREGESARLATPNLLYWSEDMYSTVHMWRLGFST